MSQDTQIIHICQQMLAIQRALKEITELDPEAPDRGPNHAHHEALELQSDALEVALVGSPPPTTSAGIQVLAELALTFVTRTSEGTLDDVETFGDWIRLFALSCAAGKPETAPLRHGLYLASINRWV